MGDKSNTGCALCAAGKAVLKGKKWPEHRLRYKHDGSEFEFHVRCTPETPSRAEIILAVKKSLMIAPRKGLKSVRASSPGR